MKSATVDSRAEIVAAVTRPYDPTATVAMGSISGIVAAPTTPYALAAAVGDCAGAGTVSRVERADTASSVVIWADSVRQGKPLPADRRYELVSAGCALEPRVQAVIVGGALDVYNDDHALHHLVFIRLGTHDTLQTMPFTNDRQLVASDRLTTRPGVIEVRCVEHPWTRAYIVVFDHPYFAVAPVGGQFSIDSLPAGERTVLSWREGQAAPVSQRVEVRPGSVTRVIVK